MNIGIDFDGVIANTPLLKMQYVKKKFNIKISIKNSSKEKLSKIIGLNNYTQMIKETYASKEMKSVIPVKGSKNSLKKLIKKHEIIIITSRTNKEVVVAKKWLKDNRINYNLLINTSNKNKSQTCKKYNINAMIEDEEKKLSEIKHNKTKKILLQREYNINKKVTKEIIICKNWEKILKVLE